ncbi:MAG: Bug family tripartite tricarboxylate transporter substrate binding protein [Alphaproteobacteria bacterium]|jgi:tripartite-type tricarboxylate transporter receptor subunit TctC
MPAFQKMALTVALCAAVTISAAVPQVVAKDGYFAGKTIKITVPYGPGGTYDQYSQTFSKHLGEHIPGKPNVIVQHMPGAGGSKAMNWAYNVMPKTGYSLLNPLDNTVLNQLMRPEKMRYDARNFTWLGSSNQTNMMIIIRSDTGVKTWKDMTKRKNIGAATGAASYGFIIQKLTSRLLNYKLQVVQGYKGSAATTFAVERGEAELNANNWLTYASRVPQWFKGENPFARVVVQVGVFKDPALPKTIPMLSEIIDNPLDKAAVKFIGVAGLLGRGLVLPPNSPKHTIKTLRASYAKMNADPAFEAALKKRRLRLIVASGAEIQKTVNDAVNNASKEAVDRARHLIYGK